MTLRGARVVLLEARKESELASLVRRHGGEPICVPALREVERECAADAARAIDAIAQGGALVVLATGAGLDRWLRVAGDLGQRERLVEALARSTVACRGPKPVAVLKREQLEAHIRAPPPHTTTELLAALEGCEVRGRAAVYVHDGGGLHAVIDALAARGARVVSLQPYEWALPEDLEPLRALVPSIVEGGADALAVTTQVQARHLFQVADALGARGALVEALKDRVVVAAVGPTSAQALRALGAPPHVVPQSSKMGALVLALASYFESRGHPPG
jgi:uroporphyrinogen-III synthase